MNFILNQIDELTGADFESKNRDEKYAEIQSVLKWDKYVSQDYPLNPNDEVLYNPALIFCQKYCEWTKKGWKSLTNTEQNILYHVPEYIPSDDCIQYLSSLDKILEIGSGNGYWSYIINKHGGNCIPTDLYPDKSNEEPCQYPVTNVYEDGSKETIWSDVKEAKHTVIPEYENHDILFCHPEGLPWTEEVLDLMAPQQRLILVAGWYPSADATPFFFKKLIDEWTLEKQIPIYKVSSSNACVYIFQKNA